MPFTLPGADIAMVRNEGTKRFDFSFENQTGNPAYDDTNEHRVLSLLVEWRDRWYAARKGRGSLLYTVKNDRASTTSQLEAYARDALKKAVDDGWIQNVTAQATRLGLGRFVLRVSWANPAGKPGNTSLSL